MAVAQKRILIVEDDIQISKVYEIQLQREGFSTMIARNGEEAIELFSAQKPDLIILDLMIPKRDGFSVLKEIRENSKNSTIPILIISNLGQNDDKKRAMDLGATEYLIKIDHPIQEIINKVKAYL